MGPEVLLGLQQEFHVLLGWSARSLSPYLTLLLATQIQMGLLCWRVLLLRGLTGLPGSTDLLGLQVWEPVDLEGWV